MLALFGVAATLAGAQDRPAAGQLLIATSASRDPDFARSVVLLVRSDGAGAVGVFLNRSTSVPLAKVFPGFDPSSNARVFQGGPLRIGVNALVRASPAPAGAARVIAGVYLVSDQGAIQRLAARGDVTLRVYLGQCGWTAAQLQDEIRRGLWRIAAGTAEVVFDARPETLWERITK
jgi:putative transcriptional regulator